MAWHSIGWYVLVWYSRVKYDVTRYVKPSGSHILVLRPKTTKIMAVSRIFMFKLHECLCLQ